MTKEYYEKKKAELLEEKAAAEKLKCNRVSKHKQKLIDELEEEYKNEQQE